MTTSLPSSLPSSQHTIEVELEGNNSVHSTNTENTVSSTNSSQKKPFNFRPVLVGSLVLGVLLMVSVIIIIAFTRNSVNPQAGTSSVDPTGNGATDIVKSRYTVDEKNGANGDPPSPPRSSVASRRGSAAVWWGGAGEVPTDPQPFHNIGEVGRGYNLLYGNPHSTEGADPGVRAAVFSMATKNPNGSLLKEARISDDGRFLMPKGVDVYQDVSCRLDWSTTMVSSASSYQKSLEDSVSASVSYNYLFFSSSFSMSRDYKEVSARTGSGSSSFAKSSAECSLYTANIRVHDQPLLSSSFFNDIMRISQGTIDDQALDYLINTYGTHVPTHVTMGARYGQQSEMSAFAASSSLETALKQTAKLSVMSSLNAEGMSDEQLKEASEFSKSCYSQRLFTMGSTPTQDGQGTTWAAQGIMDPAPIGQHELIPIYSLLTRDFFPDAEIEGLQKMLRLRLESYCSLQTNGSPICFLTGDMLDDRCVGGWVTTIQVTHPNGWNEATLVNPVTGAANCPTGYDWLTGYNDDNSPANFMRFCVSLRDDDCPIGRVNDNVNDNVIRTSFGGYYKTSQRGGVEVCYQRSKTVGPGCKCPADYTPYLVSWGEYLCLLPGARGSGRAFGGGFDTLSKIGNSYIIDPTILYSSGFAFSLFNCPLGYRVAQFIYEHSYICVLDSNSLLSNIRPVKINFPEGKANATVQSNSLLSNIRSVAPPNVQSNITTQSNISAKRVNHTMHKLHTLQHTIEANIDAAADESLQMIHKLDASDEPLQMIHNETSPVPLEISLDDDDDGGFNETYAECLEEFKKHQHASIPRQCFRRHARKLVENLKDTKIPRAHTIKLGRNNYHLDKWGRVTGFTCESGCAKQGKGRYGSHPGRMITFLRTFFGGLKIIADPDQAGHLLAPRLGISEADWPSANEVLYAKLYNNDPLNFVPLIRSVNGKRGTYYLDLDNWGNGEEYARDQLESGCEVAIEATLAYQPGIKKGSFDLEDYRPKLWTYKVISKGPKKLNCESLVYHGDNS